MKIYTYPNIGPFNRNGRGGLKQRQKALKNINKKYNTDKFRLVEIPADFIKNKTEEKKTNLKVCSFLDDKTVKHLYTPGFIDKNIKYVLHTEPVFSHQGFNGNCTPKLKWYKTGWIHKFVNHIFSIIDFLKIAPYAIEIHPGKFDRGKNNIRVLSKAINIMHGKLERKYDENILIFIENRTGQYIKDGNDINDFWEYFKENYPELTFKTGIILDIQQFYTVNKDNFIPEFSLIPKESLFGVHIHKGKHQVPSEDDLIPWKFVSEQIKNLGTQKRPLHILPEVHHAKHAEKTYKFCQDYLGL
ncbi:MAG: hypothetical protein ACOX08_03390 [Methanobacterium sp.]|uniref:hypothetical protein n=1 Tax=Methanobacterium sp. MZD130B TaxID=3394378 RepID=UPI0039FC5799